MKALITAALILSLAYGSAINAETWRGSGTCTVPTPIDSSQLCSLSSTVKNIDYFSAKPIFLKTLAYIDGVLIKREFFDTTQGEEVLFITVGSVVSCNTTHSMVFYAVRKGSTAFEKIGNVPKIICPPLP